MFLRMKLSSENVYGDSVQLGKKILRKVLLTKPVKHPLNPKTIKYQDGDALIGLLSNPARTSGHRFLILPMLNLNASP